MSELPKEPPASAPASSEDSSNDALDVVGAVDEPPMDVSGAVPSMDAIMRQWDAILQRSTLDSTPDTKRRFVPFVTSVSLEVSSSLTPFVSSNTEAGQRFFDDRLPLMKEGLFEELGVVFPGIRVRGDVHSLSGGSFAIKIEEIPVLSESLDLDLWFTYASAKQLEELGIKAVGEPSIHPVDGRSAHWVLEEDAKSLMDKDFYCWDTQGYLILQLSALLRRHARRFLGIQEVRNSLDELFFDFPALVEAACPKTVSLDRLTEILQRLVEEEISILNLKRILGSIVRWGTFEQDPVKLTEYVRMDLKKYISHKFSHGQMIVAYLISPEIEDAIEAAISRDEIGSYLSLDSEITEGLHNAIRAEIKDLPPDAERPVIVTKTELRRYVRLLTQIDFPHLPVLAFRELEPTYQLRPVSVLRLGVLPPEDDAEQEQIDAFAEKRRQAAGAPPRRPSLLQRLFRFWGRKPSRAPSGIDDASSIAPEDTPHASDVSTNAPQTPTAPPPILDGPSTQTKAPEETPRTKDTLQDNDDDDLMSLALSLPIASEDEKPHDAGEGDVVNEPEATPDIARDANVRVVEALDATESPSDAPDARTDNNANESEVPKTDERGDTEDDAQASDAITLPTATEAPEVSLSEVLPVIAYENQWEYLQERLAWLKMHILCCRGAQLSDKAPFLMTDREFGRLVSNDRTWKADGTLLPKEHDAMEKLKEQLAHRIDARLKATVLAGTELALERMRRTFGLDAYDEQIILLSLLFVYESHSELLHYALGTLRSLPASSIRLAKWILSSNPREQNRILHRFASKAPLRRYKLIEMGSAAHPSGSFEEQSFHLDAEILLRLTRDVETSVDVDGLLPLPGEMLASLDVSKELRDALQDLLARFLAEQGPGVSRAEEEPLEQLYIFDTPESSPPNWKEIFARGLVFVFSASDDTPDTDKAGLTSHRVRQFAREMSASIRRELQSLHIGVHSEQNERQATMMSGQDDVLRRAFREAKLEDAALLIDGVRGLLMGEDGTLEQQLIEEIEGHKGVVFLDGWEGALPSAWRGKVVLRLHRENGGDAIAWALSQELGPAALRQVERRGLVGLEEQLALRIVGHSSALQRISRVVRTAKAQLDARPERPDGVFLLAGPSGSGKTQTALALNDALYGRKETLLRLDMSEFHFRESISGLIGTTAGFIGYDKGGRLTRFVEQYPESVVLLDEIEKGHPFVLDLFLQVFDAGRLTDGLGKSHDLSRVTFLLTTNIGAEAFSQQKRVGFVKEIEREQSVEIVLHRLRKVLRPEFLNRIDEVLVFYPLDDEQMLEICQRLLRQLQERFAKRGLWLELASGLVQQLVARSPKEKGVRGVQQALEREISQPLTELLLEQPALQHVEVLLINDEIELKPVFGG